MRIYKSDFQLWSEISTSGPSAMAEQQVPDCVSGESSREQESDNAELSFGKTLCPSQRLTAQVPANMKGMTSTLQCTATDLHSHIGRIRASSNLGSGESSSLSHVRYRHLNNVPLLSSSRYALRVSSRACFITIATQNIHLPDSSHLVPIPAQICPHDPLLHVWQHIAYCPYILLIHLTRASSRWRC